MTGIVTKNLLIAVNTQTGAINAFRENESILWIIGVELILQILRLAWGLVGFSPSFFRILAVGHQAGGWVCFAGFETFLLVGWVCFADFETCTSWVALKIPGALVRARCTGRGLPVGLPAGFAGTVSRLPLGPIGQATWGSS